MNDISPSSDQASQSDRLTSSTDTSSMNAVDPRKWCAVCKQQSICTNEDPPEAAAQQPEISEQARCFAEITFAFFPFLVKFRQDVKESAMIEALKNHFTNTHAFTHKLTEHRLIEKRELLFCVYYQKSFDVCSDEQKWSPSIGSLDHGKFRPNQLPPQFCIVLRNVPLNIETDDLLLSIKKEHLDDLTIHRILNKDKRPTSFVRLDMQHVKTIDAILKKRFIYANNNRLAVFKCVAPAKLLICNRCFQIGHFRSTCQRE
jgi:hypothetical protein